MPFPCHRTDNSPHDGGADKHAQHSRGQPRSLPAPCARATNRLRPGSIGPGRSLRRGKPTRKARWVGDSLRGVGGVRGTWRGHPPPCGLGAARAWARGPCPTRIAVQRGGDREAGSGRRRPRGCGGKSGKGARGGLGSSLSRGPARRAICAKESRRGANTGPTGAPGFSWRQRGRSPSPPPSPAADPPEPPCSSLGPPEAFPRRTAGWVRPGPGLGRPHPHGRAEPVARG